ncbi:GPP34 family phosphoprotein OS=Streptomyces tendae OX=1932 GN=GUR47_06420 PE=4 SV=1 [Streptomyces tendae]
MLVGLAAAVGVRHESADPLADPEDDKVATVVAAVHDAVVELAATRQRRSIEEAAFDNIWRGMSTAAE